MLWVPSTDDLERLNILAIRMFETKRSDQAKTLSLTHLAKIIEECEESQGDIYDKTVLLLKGITQKHSFASGNRRTAILAAKQFLQKNKKRCKIPDDEATATTMQGIREGYYEDQEIKQWIQEGRIRAFRRTNK